MLDEIYFFFNLSYFGLFVVEFARPEIEFARSQKHGTFVVTPQLHHYEIREIPSFNSKFHQNSKKIQYSATIRWVLFLNDSHCFSIKFDT